jgi:DNA mismatch endonuclease (patch repair protein)
MDRGSKAVRSRTMSAIRKRGNRSTEWKLRSALVRAGVSGWVMHESSILGCPDFWFTKQRLAVFVDGCFWHGCRKCCRLPRQNATYWHPKIAGNTARDRSNTAQLRRTGIQVLRIWEHSLADPQELPQILQTIALLAPRSRRGK